MDLNDHRDILIIKIEKKRKNIVQNLDLPRLCFSWLFWLYFVIVHFQLGITNLIGVSLFKNLQVKTRAFVKIISSVCDLILIKQHYPKFAISSCLNAFNVAKKQVFRNIQLVFYFGVQTWFTYARSRVTTLRLNSILYLLFLTKSLYIYF